MEKAPEDLLKCQIFWNALKLGRNGRHKTITLSGKENVVLSCDMGIGSHRQFVKNALEHTRTAASEVNGANPLS